MIAALDHKLTSLMQSGYDYMRDRWDMYLATYRSLFGAMIALYGVVIPILIGPSSGAFKFFSISVLLIMLYYMAMRRHVEVEWDMQYDGREDAINARTLREQTYGYTSRWLVSAFVIISNVGFMSSSFGYLLTNIICSVFFVAYLWSRCVLIRERDMDRFAQGDFADSVG